MNNYDKYLNFDHIGMSKDSCMDNFQEKVFLVLPPLVTDFHAGDQSQGFSPLVLHHETLM